MIKHENGSQLLKRLQSQLVNQIRKRTKTGKAVTRPTEVSNRYQALDSNDQMDVSTVFVRLEDL